MCSHREVCENAACYSSTENGPLNMRHAGDVVVEWRPWWNANVLLATETHFNLVYV